VVIAAGDRRDVTPLVSPSSNYGEVIDAVTALWDQWDDRAQQP
jgi:hypothetical protein